MLKNKSCNLKRFALVWLAVFILWPQAVAGEKATGDDFFFPQKEMRFSGFAFVPSGNPLYIDDETDLLFEQPRCGFTVYRSEKSLDEWMFAIYEVIRQSRYNIRLAALPSMLSKGVLLNAKEGLEPGEFNYFDKRWETIRYVSLAYGPIKENLTAKDAEKLGGLAPDPNKFVGSDYFVSFVLPYLADLNGVQDVAFVIYFNQGVIQGFEYRLIFEEYDASSNLKDLIKDKGGEVKRVGERKYYYSYITCK